VHAYLGQLTPPPRTFRFDVAEVTLSGRLPRHPFLHGLSKHRGAPPTVVVIFGASGDLTARKLIPAIYNLGHDGLLPADFYLIGFGRKPIPTRNSAGMARRRDQGILPPRMNPEVWARLAAQHVYVAAATTRSRRSTAWRAHRRLERRSAASCSRCSTSPRRRRSSRPIIQNLGASGLAARHLGSRCQSKVVIEKPFGRDLASAQALNRELTGVFEESQVFRIDHYLGKETVQDLLVQRFANAIFEPLWNRNFIECVQITVAEEVGVGHARRLLRAERLPARHDPEPHHAAARADRDGAARVARRRGDARRKGEGAQGHPAARARAGRRRGPRAVRRRHDRRQAGARLPAGGGHQPRSRHRDLRRAAARINNWRWQGVPFYLRSGKRLARRVTEIAIQFKRPPGTLFAEDGAASISRPTRSRSRSSPTRA
jgi:glucose-6-phosphate 1-dehydrogenase